MPDIMNEMRELAGLEPLDEAYDAGSDIEDANLRVRLKNVVDRLNALFKKEYGGFSAILKWKKDRDPHIALYQRAGFIGILDVKDGDVVLSKELLRKYKSQGSKKNPIIVKIEKVIATQGR